MQSDATPAGPYQWTSFIMVTSRAASKVLIANAGHSEHYMPEAAQVNLYGLRNLQDDRCSK